MDSEVSRWAELGQARLDERRDSSHSARGLKSAHGSGVKKIRELETELARLLEQCHRLPSHVPLETVGHHDVTKLQQKAILDRVKLTAYIAAEWLLERLAPHYQSADDVRQMPRSFAELSGEIRTTAEGMTLSLDPPDSPCTAELYAAPALTSSSSTPPTRGPISPSPIRWRCTIRNAPLDPLMSSSLEATFARAAGTVATREGLVPLRCGGRDPDRGGRGALAGRAGSLRGAISAGCRHELGR